MNFRIGQSVGLLLTLCTALFLTACGQGASAGENGAEKDAQAGEGPAFSGTFRREWVYVPEVFTVEDERADYGRMQPVGDTLCYVSLGEEAVNSVRNICRYSLTDRELKSVPVNWPEGGNDWDVGYRFFTQDLSLYMTANVYPASGSMKRFLCRFDLEGNCLFSEDITEKAGSNVSIHGLTVDSQGRLYIFLDNGELLLYTGDGAYHGSVSYGSPENRMTVRIEGACEGADGKLYVCISQERMNVAGENTEETDSVLCTLAEIDFENARLLKIAENLPDIRGLCAGSRPDIDSAEAGDGSGDRYDLLLYDDTAVYGYRFDAGESDSGSVGEELFTWLDSDINGYFVTGLYLLEDGRLCATVEDWVNDDRVIVTLQRTRAEEAPRREELVLATVNGGSDLAAMAVKFNRGNGRCHLTVKNYESLTDLYNSILVKDPVDLIDLSGLNVRELAKRGFFEDLTPYVAQSELLSSSDFVDGILDVYTFGGTLAGIPSEISIRTVVGNPAELQNKEGLSLEELLAAESRYPQTKTFDGVTNEEMMQYLMMFNEDTFIDRDTGTCHFDSEEFKALLEYVDQFPDKPANSGEEALKTGLSNGEIRFAVADLYPGALRDYQKIFGENIACIGFPTADGSGGHLVFGSGAYAIAAVSENKESAWSFLEESLLQEKSDLYASIFINYPTLKKELDKKADIAIERNEVTPEEIRAVMELLPDATPFFSGESDEILQIINEEAPAYYRGQKGADDVVSVIQNRAQLYMDESGR